MSIKGSGGVCVFFDGADKVDIGQIIVHDATATILNIVRGTPLKPTNNIKIGSIRGTARNSYPFAFPSSNGEIDYLSIGEIDLTVTLDASFPLTNTNSFIRLDGAKGLNLGRCKIDVILDGFVPTTTFYAQINSALVYRSFIESWRFAVFNNDRVTPYEGHNVLTIGAPTNALAQQKLRIGEGCFSSAGGLRPYSWDEFFAGRLVSDGIPSAGYGAKGEVRWAQHPSGILRGWICTAAGTPGTWVTL